MTQKDTDKKTKNKTNISYYGRDQKNPEKVWSFTKPPPLVWSFFRKEMDPHFFPGNKIIMGETNFTLGPTSKNPL